LKKTIVLIYGGKSAEHDISILTAQSVMNAIDKEKFDVHPLYIGADGEWFKGEQIKGQIDDTTLLRSSIPIHNMIQALREVDGKVVDIVFPLLHGPNGEDGTIQGLLDVANIPYVGNGVLSSSVGMDKLVAKQLFTQRGLKQLPYVGFLHSEWLEYEDSVLHSIDKKLHFPMFVKPANLGSSLGISKVESTEELIEGIRQAFKYDRKVVVEQGVTAREIEVGVIGNDELQTTEPGEVVKQVDFYDYEAKYQEGNASLQIPAHIDEEQKKVMRHMATQAFKAADCAGLVRADFFLTEDGSIYINEINTMPGFTKFSMFPLLWANMNLAYSELIETLIHLGIERFEQRQSISFQKES